MQLQNRIWVVTGAGSGMGRELALELYRRGARVAALDINEKSLQSLPRSLTTLAIDIADRAAVEALPQRLGAVDGLINCAGIIQPFVRLNSLDYDTIDRVFAVNWRGTLYMTKAFLPSLLARPEAHIVNISSMGGFLPVPGQTIYGASKAAVKLLTEGLHAELAGTRVHVSVVFPGGVATNIAANSGVSVDAGGREYKLLSAARAARLILDGVERNQYRILVGNDAKLLDALYRLSPRRAAAFIAKQMKDLIQG